MQRAAGPGRFSAAQASFTEVSRERALARFALALLLVALPAAAAAHAIGGSDAAFVAAVRGPAPFPFAYLGAKHMVTGYDHLLFLLGVIFFLTRLRQVALYVTLFSVGHSATLLLGVLARLNVDPFLVDAVIGLSVAYKGFDNLSGWRTLTGVQPDLRLVVFGFGLVHGLGLATKLQALDPHPDGLLVNLLSFNLGVELGQLLALSMIVGAIALWRRTRSFARFSHLANASLITAGLVLAAQQLAGFINGGSA